jgi:membrane protease YdiL (CAAX protease family)
MSALHQPSGGVVSAIGPAAGSNAGDGGQAWLAILMASSIFALLHAGVAAWIAMPSLLALGIALGWLRVRTGGLIAPIIVHAAFNAMNLGLASLSPAG